MARIDRLRLIAVSVSALILSTAAGASGAFNPPILLRQADHLRLKDVAVNKTSVAVGWQEGSRPGELRVRISLDGGIKFKGAYQVAGLGSQGVSLAICGGRVWAVSAARFPGDAEKDSDLLLSSRVLTTSERTQVFLTQPAQVHRILSPQLACVGERLLAMGWLDRVGKDTRAKLRLRDLSTLTTAATDRLFDLGPAHPRGGLAVAATNAAVHVAWSKGDQQDLRYKRILVGSGSEPDITPTRTRTVATGATVWPQLAARGGKVVLAYTDDGRILFQSSADGGATLSEPRMLVRAGSLANRSRATSIDLRSSRIVVEGMRPPPRSPGGDLIPYRLESRDAGVTWTKLRLGNRGIRVGALRPMKGGGSLLLEGWHDDWDLVDYIRFQREKR